MIKRIGDSNYWVSDQGNVYSSWFNKWIELKSGSYKGGYKLVVLSIGGITKTMNVHRLVASLFVDNPLKKPVVNHKNGIKSDNRAENLEWVTYSENLAHAVKLGLRHGHGENNPSSKLSDRQVELIRNDVRKYKEICAEYMITKGLVSMIKNFKHRAASL